MGGLDSVLHGQMRLFASENTQVHAKLCLMLENMDIKRWSQSALPMIMYFVRQSHHFGII